MSGYIDLHMHSLYSSDGEYSPAELVKMCKDSGVRIMALSDHNSVKGVEQAVKCAAELGITCIPAAEFECCFEGVDLHVLGYGFDYGKRIFAEIDASFHEQELNASLKYLELTQKLGFDVSREEMRAVSESGIYIGEMFAEVLLAKPEYIGCSLLAPYRKGGERGDNPFVNFYWDFYSHGKPCYVRFDCPTFEEIIDMIHKNGGAAVLAHPGNNLKDDFGLFDRLIPLGLDGAEAFSSYHDESESEYFFEKALEKGLFVTCGSDFHGKTKPSIKPGVCRCDDKQELIESGLSRHGLI